MKTRTFRQAIRKGLSLAYRANPVRLRSGRLWTPPGKLYDLTVVGLLFVLVISSMIL